MTVNYTLNPTTFIEGTYGFIRNELADGNEGGVLINESSNRLTSLPGFPLLYPNAGRVNPDYYAFEVLEGPQAAVLGRHEHEPAAGRSVGAAASVPRRRTSGIPAG